MYAKKKLATAVAIAAGAVVLGGMQATHADSVFFPYVPGSNAVSAIISVINTSDALYGNGANQLHYTLYYKGAGMAHCEKVDVLRFTSKNDIVTFDVTGYFGDANGVLFNDPTLYNQSLALGRNVMPFRGYLIVDNRDNSSAQTMFGEAFIFEYDRGAAWGYYAYGQSTDDPSEAETSPGSEFDYSFAQTPSPVGVNIMPFGPYQTAFFVTPVNVNSADASSLGVGPAPGLATAKPENMRPEENSFRAQVRLLTEDPSATQPGNFALFDRDEGPVSGSRTAEVVCVDRVDAQSLLTTAALGELPNGGWGHLVNRRVALTSTVPPFPAPTPGWDGVTGAVIYKIEYNLTGTFEGRQVPGTFNNGMLLMNNFSDNQY